MSINTIIPLEYMTDVVTKDDLGSNSEFGIVRGNNVTIDIVNGELIHKKSDFTSDNIPVGTLIDQARGSIGNIPSWYLLADGREVDRIEYSELFNKIGTTYGKGNGTSTFNLPNENNNNYSDFTVTKYTSHTDIGANACAIRPSTGMLYIGPYGSTIWLVKPRTGNISAASASAFLNGYLSDSVFFSPDEKYLYTIYSHPRGTGTGYIYRFVLATNKVDDVVPAMGHSWSGGCFKDDTTLYLSAYNETNVYNVRMPDCEILETYPMDVTTHGGLLRCKMNKKTGEVYGITHPHYTGASGSSYLFKLDPVAKIFKFVKELPTAQYMDFAIDESRNIMYLLPHTQSVGPIYITVFDLKTKKVIATTVLSIPVTTYAHCIAYDDATDELLIPTYTDGGHVYKVKFNYSFKLIKYTNLNSITVGKIPVTTDNTNGIGRPDNTTIKVVDGVYTVIGNYNETTVKLISTPVIETAASLPIGFKSNIKMSAISRLATIKEFELTINNDPMIVIAASAGMAIYEPTLTGNVDDVVSIKVVAVDTDGNRSNIKEHLVPLEAVTSVITKPTIQAVGNTKQNPASITITISAFATVPSSKDTLSSTNLYIYTDEACTNLAYSKKNIVTGMPEFTNTTTFKLFPSPVLKADATYYVVAERVGTTLGVSYPSLPVAYQMGGINTPTIVSPTALQAVNTKNFTVTASAYTTTVATTLLPLDFQNTDWKITSDIEGLNILHSVMDDTPAISKTFIDLDIVGTAYCFVRYRSTILGLSEWSNPRAITLGIIYKPTWATTATQFRDKTVPINNTPMVVTAFLATTTIPTEIHTSSTFRICSDIDGKNVLIERIATGSASAMTNVSITDLPGENLVNGQYLYYFCKFTGAVLGDSEWSEPLRIIIGKYKDSNFNNPTNDLFMENHTTIMSMLAKPIVQNIETAVVTAPNRMQIKATTDSAGDDIIFDTGDIAYTASYVVNFNPRLTPGSKIYFFCKYGNIATATANWGYTDWSPPLSRIVSSIIKPTLLTPTENAQISKIGITLTTPAMTMNGTMTVPPSHISTDWRISEDIDGTKIKYNTTSTTDKLVHTIEDPGLDYDNTYYASCRFNSNNYASSEWSDPRKFSTTKLAHGVRTQGGVCIGPFNDISSGNKDYWLIVALAQYRIRCTTSNRFATNAAEVSALTLTEFTGTTDPDTQDGSINTDKLISDIPGDGSSYIQHIVREISCENITNYSIPNIQDLERIYANRAVIDSNDETSNDTGITINNLATIFGSSKIVPSSTRLSATNYKTLMSSGARGTTAYITALTTNTYIIPIKRIVVGS